MDIRELSFALPDKQRRDIAGYERLEVLLHGQSDVLEMISRGASLPAILEAIVHWVELQSNDNFFASILLLDKDGKHLLHGAAPNLPDEYNQAIHGAAIGPNAGSCGTAAYFAETIIVDDIQTDPRWVNYKDLALPFGLKACWSAPLLAKGGKVLGTFAIYYTEPKRPTPDDLEIIRLVSRTAVIAIEHKQAEEERQRLMANEVQTEQRFRAMIEEAPVATAIYTGREMIVSLANDAMLKLWGKTASVIGKPLHLALPELEGQPFLQLLSDVYASGETYSAKDARADLVVDGMLQAFYFNFTYKPLRDIHGNVYAILNMAVDVTESVLARKEIEKQEERYRMLAMDLERRVQERTRDLQRANESLERSNADLAQYAYVASHDLQEPLRKIRVFSSMLNDLHELSAPASDLLSRIMSSAERMSQLINDVLEFSRLHNAGKAIQVTSLNEVLQNVMQDFELAIKEKHATIEAGELPELEAVPLHMNQLFTNLLSNALKFSKDDTPLKVEVTAHPVNEETASEYALQKGKRYFEIIFSDNGIGFESEFADQVFEMFRRLHDKQVYPGSGIGLALCRKIVENHQGYIFAESAEGKGTAIHIILPATQ